MASLQELVRAIRPLQSIRSHRTASTDSLLGRQQIRHASILSELSDNPKAYNRRIRVGRGASSGKGKTSGRGHKGQGQHGKVPFRFEGGQTPLRVVKGLRGFENVHALDMAPVNLDRVQDWINKGRLDPSRTITVKELVQSRCIHGVKDGVKLLARGATDLKTPVDIIVSRASAAAISAVEAAGGTIMTRYYTAPSIRRILRGQSDADTRLPGVFPPIPKGPIKKFKYRLPDPTSRKDIEYYRDPAHRGYLSHLVPEGKGPSLFYRTPSLARRSARTGDASQRTKKSLGADLRLW